MQLRDVEEDHTAVTLGEVLTVTDVEELTLPLGVALKDDRDNALAAGSDVIVTLGVKLPLDMSLCVMLPSALPLGVPLMEGVLDGHALTLEEKVAARPVGDNRVVVLANALADS